MFYTYLWLREDGTPYYVGKGSGQRAFIKDDHRFNVPPKERVVIYSAESEADAFETEVALVWYYGRKDLGTGCLRNLTDGGEKPPSPKGKKFSEEHRLNLAKASRKSQSKRFANPLERKAASERTKKHQEKPEVRAQNSITQRKLWEDPKYRAWMTEKRIKQGERKRRQHGGLQ